MILDTKTALALRDAMQSARAGNLSHAIQIGETILRKTEGGGIIPAFLGMLNCQNGDRLAGISYFRRALDLNPNDTASAVNLATALVDTNALDEALVVCSPDMAMRDASAKIWRLRGYVLQKQQQYEMSVTAYEHVVAIHKNDVDAWNNLGNARVGAGDQQGGIQALRKAMNLDLAVAPIRLNLAGALIDAGLFDEALETLERCASDFREDTTSLIEMAMLFHQLDRPREALAAMVRAVDRKPNDADLMVRLGEQQMINSFVEEAQKAFQRAILLVPTHGSARLQLGLLLEQTNQLDSLRDLTKNSVEVDTDFGIVNFLLALICRREQRFEEGLQLLKSVQPEIEPVKREQLIGEFYDRLGKSDAAFAAFSQVNLLLSLDPSQPLARAASYLNRVKSDASRIDQEWYNSWLPFSNVSGRSDPVFLVGFPRSGTTLLDTILMGHHNIQILEERPALRHVIDRIGDIDLLPELKCAEIEQLRRYYFSEVEKYISIKQYTTLIDKFPLYLNKIPYILRLFPDAKFLLAIRHSYDVALSCFITSFRLNNAMSNFLEITSIIDTYKATFEYWEKCRSIMPMNVHIVYYEDVVSNCQFEYEKILPFIELEQNEIKIDHQKYAWERGAIPTASYSQVLEPIYTRGTGRWQRYKEHIPEVISNLEPWVRHWGYSMD